MVILSVQIIFEQHIYTAKLDQKQQILVRFFQTFDELRNEKTSLQALRCVHARSG